ncbi:GPR1/FUN34/yaaH family-domain-containing protein [Trichoderma asperelloides]|nr:GPR1/FUN34/yaaH family-domain-containing protein [Trichoderma asperelloides]
MSHLISSVTNGDEESAEKVQVVYQNLGPRLANPSPLAMAGFATSLLTVSLSMMGFRGVSNQTVFVGDLCFVACIALLISAQWEMVRGNTFSYTVLSAFGLFYGGYGAIMIPSLGVVDVFGGYTPEFYNAMGFFILIWAVLNIFFLVASVAFNIVYICIFITIEVCFTLEASSYFALADGNTRLSIALMKAAGVFGFLAGLLGFYTTAHYLCQDVLPFHIPMGDTSGLVKRWKKAKIME